MSIPKLSRLVGILFIYALFACPSAAKQSAKQTAAGKIVEANIPAPSLKGNLLGDGVEQKISVYLPPSYDTAPTKRYPVVYLLHSFGIGRHMWMRDAGFNIVPVLNGLINSGKAREMIVVAPNARNVFNGSFYVNSATTGNWEDYIFRDVVPYVDANYRTLARASSRGIAGLSMGGFGAVSMGMKHPDIFSAIYALSPCCLGMEGEFLEPLPAWTEIPKFTSKEDFLNLPRTPDKFWARAFPAISAAFSPNAENKPIYGDLLYREQDGKLVRNEAVATRWKAKMPLYLVDEYKSNLLSLCAAYFWITGKKRSSRIFESPPRYSPKHWRSAVSRTRSRFTLVTIIS
jgi:S-formylglutathione hydrolase